MPHNENHNNQVDPYAYMKAYSDDYSTGQAFSDIGYDVNQDFLSTTDEDSGLTYRDLIPEYDPFEEERMRTEFAQGARSMYESTVGELAGLTGQVRQQQAASGFMGSGTSQQMIGEARSDLQSGYGSAFEGALLDLTSGIRSQRTQYQDDLAALLQSFGSGAFVPQDAPLNYGSGNDFEAGARLGNSDFFFPGEASEGDTIKAANGMNYEFTSGTWSLIQQEIETGGGNDELGSGLASGSEEEGTYSNIPTEYVGDTITVGSSVYTWNSTAEQYELEI